MQAIIADEYGQYHTLKLKQTDKPVPKEQEVLIRIHAVSINHADVELLKGSFILRLAGYGLFRPKHKILGSDISGTVEAIGRNVKDFKPGDEVLGDLSACGLGGFAEYVCADPKYLVQKPRNITHNEAVAVPMAGVTALQGLRKSNIQAGQKVLINGASGGVGSYALQLAKYFGCQVTAVCSTKNLEWAKLLGADPVIDYTKEDFTKGNQKYDLIIGVNGYHPLKDYKSVLNEKGTYLMIGGSGAQILEGMLYTPFASKKDGKKLVSLGAAKPNKEDLKWIISLLEKGKLKAPIDRVYPLKDTAEAFRYMTEEHARGKIVISVK